MSQALASASSLKPEIRLTQAVSQFEAVLSSEQKAAFRAHKYQSQKSPPDQSEVIRLSAEIDRTTRMKGGRSGFGHRMTNFLHAVQQFAAIGDVIVGGSQNVFACGVWTVVRMSLLAIVVHAAYLETFSNLIMNIGRSAPRYENMALLYPQSRTLQSHLLEYFVVVVRLCHRLLNFTQKSALKQFASALGDSDLKSFQPELEQWANAIKEEANLLMAKEIKEITGIKGLLIRDSESASRRRKLKTQLRVLNSCSTYKHETTWNQMRKIGTTTLFHQSAEYRNWKGRADSCTLVYTGKLGSGKSVLLANIVEDLTISTQDRTTPVAYFFCRHDIQESLKARTIMGSLARQLLRPIPDLAIAAEFLDETTSNLDLESLFHLLWRTLPPDSKAYFILDGLDECDITERGVLIEQLRRLQETFTLRLCVSIRLEAANVQTLGLERQQFIAAKSISIPDDNPEIDSFIESELKSLVESGKLKLRNPALILEIWDALTKGSQGMWLWAVLQIKTLCAMRTDEAIHQALNNLPKDLPETFSRILRKSADNEEGGESYQRRVLELITAARRPLTTEELREALSVVPGDTVWKPSSLLNDILPILACCGGLVIVDEEEQTVRLVHHSVKQFLLGGFKDLTDIQFTMDSANKMAADIIITYLSYGVFETQLSTTMVPQMKMGSAPSEIIGSSNIIRSLALEYLKLRKRPDIDIGRTVADASRFYTTRLVDDFHFHFYAKSYCLQHVLSASMQEPIMYRLLIRLLKENAVEANAIDADGWTPLLKAAEGGHEAVVRALLESGKVDSHINAKDTDGRTPLLIATEGGHEAIIRMLLESSKVDANARDKCSRTPLLRAAEGGHEAIVRILLESCKVDVDVNAKDIKCGRTPLLRAVEEGQEAVVKLLLEMGQVDANTKDGDGWTPLLRAVEGGYEAIVKALLEVGKVNVNVKNADGQTALLRAAGSGHEAVVKLLLETGKVDVDSKDKSGRTPLSWAAENGHEAVVKLLLETGKVDVNSKDAIGRTTLSWDSLGRTPLLWAAENGHEAVVKLLLETSKVEVESKDNRYSRTPLSWAAGNGHEAVVKLLLETGKVDVNSKDAIGRTTLSWDTLGRTPLLWAAENGHEAVVKLLLETRKVDVDLKDKSGRTPLSRAAENGHEAVVKLLLETGMVEVELKDNTYGRTPLSWAAGNGHEAVVKLLLEIGKVEVELKDKYSRTPLSWAAENGHEAVVKLLQSYGAL